LPQPADIVDATSAKQTLIEIKMSGFFFD